MSLQHVDIFFEVVVFLFAISVHESAHAFTANLCGDPTAKMLGRVSLNPIRHIDPIGTIVLPALALLYHIPMIGWAKPTPVDPRNFSHEIRDEILTSVAGPISNLIVALGALLGMVIIVQLPGGRDAVFNAVNIVLSHQYEVETQSALLPISVFLYDAIVLNLLLACFNLIPVPPLDGSHVLRHALSGFARDIYDRVGMIGMLLLFLTPAGSYLVRTMMYPVLRVFNSVLLSAMRG